MKYEANTPEAYLAQLPQERRAPMEHLRRVILASLPEGFEESMPYGMIGYVVPHSRYPSGYHANPKLPLPFLSIASQKHFIALYHQGIYADPGLRQWFVEACREQTSAPPDMGKSCIRFRHPDRIPFGLIGELCAKMSVNQWIQCYEKALQQ